MGVTDAERRVLEAAKRCCERWGIAKVNVDDIAAEAGVSRATLYRLFPGGKDVLFEALRVLELEEFFDRLETHLDGVDDLEELLTRAVVCSLADLHADQHLALMMAAAPGELVGDLSIDMMPRIIRVACVFLTPLLHPYVDDRAAAARVVEVLVRLVISQFFAPSELLDLRLEPVAREFVRTYVLPTLVTTVR